MREPLAAKKEKLRAELVRANEKAREWQARARDIERQITECENMEILQAVRGVASSPEELRAVLDLIQTITVSPATNFEKEN